MPMTEAEAKAYHQRSWDEYNRLIAAREDDYDEIVGKISSANYFAGDAVIVTMDTQQWDMAQRLITIGWDALQKSKR